MVDQVRLDLVRENLVEKLWPQYAPSSMKTWLILDGARDKRIYEAVDWSYQQKVCLFAGDLSHPFRQVAPHLLQVDSEDRLTKFVLSNGWGHSWGIFFRSNTTLETLRRHFRKFLRVSDARGRRMLFRYYDPRVLNIYLPTCTPDELATFFGPVERFLPEAEGGTELIDYRLVRKALSIEKRQL